MTTRLLFGNDIDHPRNIETTSGSRSLATAGGARTSKAPTSTSTRFKVPSPLRASAIPVDTFYKLADDPQDAAKARPHHRRGSRWRRGRVADRRARHFGGAARDAPRLHDRGAQDIRPRRTCLLELVPLRRQGTQRR